MFAPLFWFPPLLDKMVDDEASNEKDDEGHNAEDLIPHLPAPSFSIPWGFPLSVFLLHSVSSYHSDAGRPVLLAQVQTVQLSPFLIYWRI